LWAAFCRKRKAPWRSREILSKLRGKKDGLKKKKTNFGPRKRFLRIGESSLLKRLEIMET